MYIYRYTCIYIYIYVYVYIYIYILESRGFQRYCLKCTLEGPQFEERNTTLLNMHGSNANHKS